MDGAGTNIPHRTTTLWSSLACPPLKRCRPTAASGPPLAQQRVRAWAAARTRRRRGAASAGGAHRNVWSRHAAASGGRGSGGGGAVATRGGVSVCCTEEVLVATVAARGGTRHAGGGGGGGAAPQAWREDLGGPACARGGAAFCCTEEHQCRGVAGCRWRRCAEREDCSGRRHQVESPCVRCGVGTAAIAAAAPPRRARRPA
eukprot:366243-Chlamydomonas_euryale.AAC.2